MALRHRFKRRIKNAKTDRIQCRMAMVRLGMKCKLDSDNWVIMMANHLRLV
jgi:hypothetical protein